MKEWILLPDNRTDLMQYRLEMAEERLKSSKILLDAGSYKDSISRSYYAMFTAVRALLAIDGQDFSKHAGVIAYFQKEYIKSGKIEKSILNTINEQIKKLHNAPMLLKS